MILLVLLSAPCGFASHQAEAQLRGNLQPDSEVISPRNAGVPHIAGVVSAAQRVLANINQSWPDIQGLFVQANQTVVDVVDSATTKIDSIKPILGKLRSAAGDFDGAPSSPKVSADVSQGLVIAFIHEVNTSSGIARNRILNAESQVFAATQRALDEIRETMETVVLRFREALKKVADMAAILDDAAVSFQGSSSSAKKPAKRGGMKARQRHWPFSSGGYEPSVWDATTVAIVAANETLDLLVYKLDGVNATLVEGGVNPIGSIAQVAMADFAAACATTIFVLPDKAPPQANEACSAIEGASGVLTGVIADGLGKLESYTSHVVEKAKGLYGPIFDMVEVLYELVDQAQDAFEQLKGDAAATA